MTRIIPLLTLALALASCGTTRTERGLSGAALGAGVGAGASAITGGNLLGGALLGGAAGGATGALTSPEQLDLGKPLWKH